MSFDEEELDPHGECAAEIRRLQGELDGRANAKPEVTFTYKNYRGETSVRLVRPIMLAFGATGFHPEPQWLLHAWDVQKEAERTFAVKDIKDWDATR